MTTLRRDVNDCVAHEIEDFIGHYVAAAICGRLFDSRKWPPAPHVTCVWCAAGVRGRGSDIVRESIAAAVEDMTPEAEAAWLDRETIRDDR